MGSVLKGAPYPEITAVSGNQYPVTVNYDLTVEQMVQAGQYDWSCPDINSSNFLTDNQGQVKASIELIKFGLCLKTEEVLARLDASGLRPARVHELLALGANYPELQRECVVAALGSPWQLEENSTHYVVCLKGNSL